MAAFYLFTYPLKVIVSLMGTPPIIATPRWMRSVVWRRPLLLSMYCKAACVYVVCSEGGSGERKIEMRSIKGAVYTLCVWSVLGRWAFSTYAVYS